MAGEVIPIVIRRNRELIVNRLREAGATAPQRAIALDPDTLDGPGRLLRRREWARLRRFGAVREPRLGLFYLDEDRLTAYRASLRRKVGALLGAAAMLAGAAVALS